MRYVELNPVRAKLVARAEDWQWSSAASHVHGSVDLLMTPGGPLVNLREDWSEWLSRGMDDATLQELRLATATGRPCGDDTFVRTFEDKLNRLLRPQKPGPKQSSSPCDDELQEAFL